MEEYTRRTAGVSAFAGTGGRPHVKAAIVNLPCGAYKDQPVSMEEMKAWQRPPFQRPININEKVRMFSRDLRETGKIFDWIVLGRICDEPELWLVDGNHRREGANMSGLSDFQIDVEIVRYENMDEMAADYVRRQKYLVKMQPNDLLRGKEGVVPALRRIRTECPFVGYDKVRRTSTTISMLSMAVVLRFWCGSRPESPVANFGSTPSEEYASEISAEEVEHLITFLKIAHEAWGMGVEYSRLWNGLNLGLCMWMYRRVVLDINRIGRRSTHLNAEEFKQCLLALSASGNYLDWVQGRSLNDKSRTPTYKKLKAIFVERLREEGVEDPKLPQPAWAS